MAKRKKRKQRVTGSTTLLQKGFQAFKSGDYDRAIEMWEQVGHQPPQTSPVSALAQVYFRRGLKRIYGASPDPDAGLSDLERASALQPQSSCYTYHLALAAHRLGDLERAVQMYTVARKDGDEFAQRAAFPLALATLQSGRDPASTSAWSALSTQEQAMLRHASAFHRRPYTLPSDAPSLWRGLAALDAGEHEQAQALLDEALSHAANATEEGVARYYLGVLAAQDEKWDAARQHWNAARALDLSILRLDDILGEAYHRLAEERLESGDAEGALFAGIESRRHKPNDRRLGELISQAHQRLASEAASAGRWADARRHWEAADEVEGGSFRLAYNLALACEQTEDFITAGEKWREALRRRPRRDDHPDAIDDEQVAQLWRRSAEAYRRIGEYDEAVHVYRQAVKWNPKHIDTRMALAELLMVNGQLRAADNELCRILERDPNNVPALLRRGEVIAASGYGWWGESPLSCWERVLELEPDNRAARQLLADFYQEQADRALYWPNFPRAIEMYQQALTYMPQNGRILAALGGCYLRMNKRDVAQGYIEQALDVDPSNLHVYDQIIRAWLIVGDSDQAWAAMARAEAAIEEIPYDFYVTQALCCIQNQQSSDLARPWLARAVENAPPDEPALMFIGQMAVVAQEWDLAREYLEQAIAAGQEAGQSHLLLGIVDAHENNLGAARKHWNKAEQIARREHDHELMERVDMARLLFSAPPGLMNLLMGLGGNPFDGLDFDEDDEDDFWD